METLIPDPKMILYPEPVVTQQETQQQKPENELISHQSKQKDFLMVNPKNYISLS